MKDQILTQLEEQCQGVNVSKTFLERIAESIEQTIEKEEDIPVAISNLQDLILETAKENDRRVTEAVEKMKATQQVAAQEASEAAQEVPLAQPVEEMPLWAKKLVDKVNRLEKAETKQGIQQKIATALKGIPPSFYKGNIPEDEEHLQERIQEIITDFNSFKQKWINAGLGGDKPADGAHGANKGKVVSPDVVAFTRKQTLNKVINN